MTGGDLLFGPTSQFPALWIVGVIGFIGLCWYCWRGAPATRRVFLVLWVPAALAAAVVYMLDGHGYAVSDSLRLVARQDPTVLRLLAQAPTDGFVATYAFVVGGAAAALATMALQFVGVVTVPQWMCSPPSS